MRIRWFGLLIAGNVMLAGMLALALWFDSPLLAVVGLLALCTPGLLFALLLEQLAGQQPPERLALAAAVFTVTVTPMLVWLTDRLVFQGTGVVSSLEPFVLVWAVMGVVWAGGTIVCRRPSGLAGLQRPPTALRELATALALFALVLLLNAYLYPFIPEADGYGYLIKLREGVAQPALFEVDPRAMFLTFVQLASLVSGISPYWVLKLMLPLGSLLLGATCWLVAAEQTRDRTVRMLAALVPLSIPVVLQELLVGRPQSLVLLALVPSLYLVARFAEPGAVKNLYWLGVLAGIGLVGTRIHTLMVLLLLIAAAGAGRILWPVLRRHPVDGLAVGAVILFLALPWLQSFRIATDLWHILGLVWQTLSEQSFRLWFLDHYRNVDGAEVGWQGWSWVLYYGYSLGLFVPLLWLNSLFIRVRRDDRWGALRREWPAAGVGMIMLVIAEVLPRFGLAYLPDRAWLFLSLSLVVVAPYLIAALRRAGMGRLLVFLLLAAVGTSTALTVAKQGWMTKAEYAAVPFVRGETDQQAIILGQGASRPAIRYYAERTFLAAPPTLFLSDDEDAVEQYLRDQQAAYEAARARLGVDQQFMRESFERLAARVPGLTTAAQQQVLVEEARAVATLFGQGDYTEARLADHFLLADKQPVYLLYDATKFDSLYGQRAWWRTSNFFGANTDKFSRRYPVVYDQGGVKLWQVR